MDPDAFLAVQDAVGIYRPDEVVISTQPYPRSGFLRRDLVERIQQAFGLPVEHVLVDLETEPVKHALVVANETVSERPLIEALEKRPSESPHRFTIISPQGVESRGGSGGEERLERTVEELRQAGSMSRARSWTPIRSRRPERHDRVTAERDHRLDFQGQQRSRWRRIDLVERVRRATGRQVEHIAVEPAGQQATGVGAG